MCGYADVRIMRRIKKRLPDFREAFLIYLHKPAAHFALLQLVLHTVVHFLFVHFLQSPGFANAPAVNITARVITMIFFMILNFT